MGAGAVDARSLGLSRTPGHLVRRAQQVHTAIWVSRLHGELTGPQYACLVALWTEPGVDQNRLSELASLDKNTTADLLRRMVARGWVDRSVHPADSRRRVLHLTASARTALRRITPAARLVQEEVLRPLPLSRQDKFVAHLASVASVEDLISAPSARREPAPDLPVLRLHDTPGYLLRRAERVHNGLWLDVVGAQLTPPQYAMLSAIEASPGCDQATAGRLASLDSSSTADVVARLLRGDWIERRSSTTHGRRVSLQLASASPERLREITALVRQVQDAMLRPLDAASARLFVEDLFTVAFRGTPQPA